VNPSAAIPIATPSRLGDFLRGDVEAMESWVARFDARRLAFCLAVIVIGAGAFGASVGVWRSPLQALYTAAKLPFIILLTTLGNGLLNGMLAPLLGLNLRFRQSLLAILMSFTVAAAIFGSLSPVMLFVAWKVPPLDLVAPRERLGFESVQLINVAAIAFAGVVANVRLFQLLARLGGGRGVAQRVMLAWLAGNLFLGAQLAWNLRPFLGAPELPVEFLRPNAFEGNFFETVHNSFSRFFTAH
jgi:hypothetical protein